MYGQGTRRIIRGLNEAFHAQKIGTVIRGEQF